MFGGDAGPEAAERRVDDWRTGFEQQAARARDLGQRLRVLATTAACEDGSVEVTVTSSGALADLRLDEAIRTRPAAETAATILAVTRTALNRLTEQVADAAEEVLGPDSPVGRALVDSYRQRLSVPDGGDRAARR